MSCASTRTKSCHDKSCERYYNNTAQALPVNTTLTLTIAGNNVVDSGVSIEAAPQAYTVLKTGLYHISGDVTINATAAGVVIFQVYMDGVALPCTKKTVTLSAGDNVIHTETDLRLSNCCCDINRSFTYVLTTDDTATGSIIELCTGVLKLA